MPEKTQAEPGFAVVRNSKTGLEYVTKWRDDDVTVLHDNLEVDGAGTPVLPADYKPNKKTATAAEES